MRFIKLFVLFATKKYNKNELKEIIKSNNLLTQKKYKNIKIKRSKICKK